MLSRIKSIHTQLSTTALQMLAFLQDPSSEYGEESASVAAITGLVLLVIIAVMAIFRTTLIGAFNRIAALLGF